MIPFMILLDSHLAKLANPLATWAMTSVFPDLVIPNRALMDPSSFRTACNFSASERCRTSVTWSKLTDKTNGYHPARQTNHSLPFPHKFAIAPATIRRVWGSSVLEAALARSLAPPLFVIKPWFISEGRQVCFWGALKLSSPKTWRTLCIW